MDGPSIDLGETVQVLQLLSRIEKGSRQAEKVLVAAVGAGRISHRSGLIMHFANRPQDRLLCTEPLEARWLLSGLALPAAPYVDGPVLVMELEVESDDDDEGDVEVAPSELPEQVVAALDGRFPGAKVLEADFSVEHGKPEYGVTARFSGEVIDVTLTPEG